MKHSIIKSKSQKVIIIAFWFAAWQLAAIIIDQPLYLPSVIDSVKSVFVIVGKRGFWINVGATFLRVIIGLGLSAFLGIVLGIISAKSKFFNALLSPFFSTVKAIPTMSIIILALVWLKSGNVPVFVVLLLCFPIIYTNTLNGIHNIDPQFLELCDVYQISTKRKILDVMIPSVRPYIQSAMMVCIGLSWKSAIAAEVLSAPSRSMGYQLYTTKLYLEIPDLFAWTIIVVGFSMGIEKLFKRFLYQKQIKE